jgi:hypothetical protein
MIRMRIAEHRRRGTNTERGMSLVEMIIAVAVTTIVMVVVMSMIEEAARLSLFMESHNDLVTLSQRPLNLIQREVLQERYVFQEDATGTPYRQQIETQIASLATNPQVVPVSLLPVFDPIGTMAPDTGGVRHVGNAVLVARQLPPIVIALAADATAPGYAAVNYVADRYQFEYFYLSRTNTRKFRNGDYVLDLVRYQSIQFADYFQLVNSVSTLSSSQLSSLATQLKATTAAGLTAATIALGTAPPNLQTAWNPGQPYATSFYTIPASLNFLSPVVNPLAAPALTKVTATSVIPDLNRGRISGKMTYTIAYRVGATGPGVPITGATGRHPVPLYAESTTSLPVDCGFEVKVVGASGSRQALARLVLYSYYGVNSVDSQDAMVITSFSR